MALLLVHASDNILLAFKDELENGDRPITTISDTASPTLISSQDHARVHVDMVLWCDSPA